MAPRGKQTSGGSESKLGLILTLIFFILATFILGTLAYFGYTEQEQLVAKEKEANKKRQDAEGRLEEERARKLVLRIINGSDTPEDQQDFAGLVNQRPQAVLEEFNKVVAQMKKDLPDDFVWDMTGTNPAPKPTNTLPNLILKYKDDVRKAIDARIIAEKSTGTAQAERDQARQQMTANKKEFDDKVLALSNQFKQLQGDKAEGFTKVEVLNDDLSKQLEKIKRDKRNSEDALEKELARLKEDMNKISTKLAYFESQRRPPDVDLNSPKGSIVRREKDVVYIDIGSSDGLRAGTTFSIFPAERGGNLPSSARGEIKIDLTGKVSVGDGRLADAPPEMKGAIEVMDVIGPTASSCRITYELDPVRNPIRPKDNLFNPAWTPGMKEHIAIAGMIDLNGDGLDDNDEFIRMLEKQGVVVDSYIDLKDRQIKGKGITLQTSYLILGPSPDLDGTFNTGGIDTGGDPRSIVKREVINQMTKMQNQAKELGVQPMSARRFLSMNGIKLPRNPANADYSAGRYLRDSGAQPMPKDGQ